MRTSFDSTDVLLLHRQGQPCLLPGTGFSWWWRGGHFRYRGYTDGMSSPQFTHALPGLEPYGWALPAAVPHDGGYHRGLEQETPAGWRPFALGKDDCDQMLQELLQLLAGEDREKQDLVPIIYEAVCLGGGPAWEQGGRPDAPTTPGTPAACAPRPD